MANAELKTKKTKVSADAFINAIKNEQERADCKTIAKMMSEITKAKPVMWGPSIVGFGDWHYVYDSGRENDWFMMGFSPRKQNLTLYLMPGFDGFESEMDKLGKYKTGRCCLYIKKLSDVDMTVLKKIMTGAAKRMKVIAKAPTAQAGVRELKKKAAAKKASKKKITKKA